jgi:E3 ubiquitin-protein ligase RAD18
MNSNKLATLLALNMPDPTDFPGQPASLRDLDSAVRCTICANFFDAPVSLPCGHSFCSMVRRQVYRGLGALSLFSVHTRRVV